MSSAAKAIANRANATLSTGPADTSRTRFNGIAHGLTSKQSVIPGENQQDYEAFESAMFSDLAPASTIETLLVERIITAAWRLKRFARVETAFFTSRIEDFLKHNPDTDPGIAMANLFSDPAEAGRMRLFLRYQTSVQKEYDTAMCELQKAKAERASQSMERTVASIIRSSDSPLPTKPRSGSGIAATAIAKPAATASSNLGFASQTSIALEPAQAAAPSN